MESGKIEPLQLRYVDSPWRVVVTCIFLNLTTREAVEGMLDTFFERWPTPTAAAAGNLAEMEAVMRPLGLWRRRASSIQRLSVAWVMRWGNGAGESPEGLPGVGQYALDAWKIFCKGERNFEPGDRMLRAYLRRLCRADSAAAK